MGHDIRDFERELRDVRGLSENTVHVYRNESDLFCRFLRGIGKSVYSCTRDDVIAWRKSVEEKRKPAGLRLAAVSIRIYLEWLAETKQIEQSPFPAHFKIRVKERELTAVPTVQQFLQMRELMKDKEQFRVAVEVLAGSGLRVSALLTMKVKHLKLDDKPCVMVDEDMSCKGKRMAPVPLSKYSAELLTEHVKGKGQDELVFSLEYKSFYERIRRLALKLTEPMKIKPHSFRHFYCAMTYYRNFEGGRFNVVWVRDAAGHSNMMITDRYLKLAQIVCGSDAEWEQWALGKAVAA